MNKELLQQVLVAAVSTLEGLGYTYHGGEQWQPPTRAAIAQPEKPIPNIQFLYEELRQLIDGGSESMTHDDALAQIKYWRGLTAIAQPEQTANKCVCARHNGFCVCAFKTAKVEPAQLESKAEKRQPLTDSHLCVLLLDIDPETKRLPPGFKAFARAIETAHGIKA